MVITAIVEDDSETAEGLKHYLLRYAKEKGTEFQITHFPTAEELLANLHHKYQLLLMDINLPGMDGMAAARKLRELGYSTPLIFITTLSQYAVYGYEVDALDFMLKPVNYFQFSMKLDKAFRKISRNLSTYLSISVDRSQRIISSSELYYVETSHHDLVFHMAGEDLRTRGSLSAIESQLLGFHFLRINTCYLINMGYINRIGKNSVTMLNGDELYISRARLKSVMCAITEFLGGSI